MLENEDFYGKLNKLVSSFTKFMDSRRKISQLLYEKIAILVKAKHAKISNIETLKKNLKKAIKKRNEAIKEIKEDKKLVEAKKIIKTLEEEL